MGNNVLTEGKTPSIPTPPITPSKTNSVGIGETKNGLTSNITTPPPPPSTSVIK